MQMICEILMLNIISLEMLSSYLWFVNVNTLDFRAAEFWSSREILKTSTEFY